ncbi:MAG TPA: DUF4156 domain-containing protein [Myxococcaceae bacterium]|nr:DUF4156 domain-containing protein [Myxococcaceae bacterium]
MTGRHRFFGLLPLLALGACATGEVRRVASPALLEPRDGSCTTLGQVSVRSSTELLMSEDALLSSAVNELRRQAALRGATHLVVSRPAFAATVAYGTTAAASGVAYRCPASD